MVLYVQCHLAVIRHLLCSPCAPRTMAQTVAGSQLSATISDGDYTQEELVAQNDKIDALIATVRELNHQVRPKLNEEIGGGSGNMAELHKVLGEMRDRELISSHGVKRMILSSREGVDDQEIQHMMGTSDARITLEEALAIHADTATLPTRVVMSEFASAREAILSLLRGLPEDDWTHKSTLAIDEGRDSVAAVVDSLIEDDRKAMEKIHQLLGVAA
jgi:hypothetical protein